MRNTSATLSTLLLGLVLAGSVRGMELKRSDSRLVLSGANFRYTWDTTRGGELTLVEQPGLKEGGWWSRGTIKVNPGPLQRVNSSFAWKLLDTIPALSFSNSRAAYYSLEWKIAYNSADREASLKLLSHNPREVTFETLSNPKIFENRKAPIPWKVRQRVRVFDSGVIIIRLAIELPENEVYELDWAQMGVNLDDILYKEPSPEKQAAFDCAALAVDDGQWLNCQWKPLLQDVRHMPLDIDLDVPKSILPRKPVLIAAASYDLTHVKGAARNGYMECALEEARSLCGSKADFGSYAMIRKSSGMRPPPPYAGAHRNNPCFSAMWNLWDGPVQGLNERLSYENTLTLAFGSRKRSARPEAAGDDRNLLLGARIYYAKDEMPGSSEIAAMAADGCNTLLLGASWRKDENKAKAVVEMAHNANMRVGICVDAAELPVLLKDQKWFSGLLQKERDGVLVQRLGFVKGAMPEGTLELMGEKAVVKSEGPERANAAAFALCMRALRELVGAKGFLIGLPSEPGPMLLALAEFDLWAGADPAVDEGTPQSRCAKRYRGSAGFGPLGPTLSASAIARAAIHADTPVLFWPPKSKEHLALWKLYQRLPAEGFRVASDLLPAERPFSLSSAGVHGTFFDSGAGKGILLLAAEKEGASSVAVSLPGLTTVKGLDGAAAAVNKDTFEAGAFAAWKVKGFEITFDAQNAASDK